MAFKPRFSRREEGGYSATYGKGTKKLSAVLLQYDDGKWWVHEGFGEKTVDPSKKLGDVKEGWGKLAEAAYGGEPIRQTADVPASAPTPARSGPPSLRRAGPPVLAPPAIKPPKLHTPLLNDDTHGEGFAEAFRTPELAEEGAECCAVCGQPESGWTQDDRGRFLPPCRCGKDYSGPFEADPFDPRMVKRGKSGKFDTITPIGVLAAVFHWMQQNPEYVRTDGVLDEPWASVRTTLHDTTGYPEYRPENE